MDALVWRDATRRSPVRGENVLLLFESEGKVYIRTGQYDGARWSQPGTQTTYTIQPSMWASIPLPRRYTPDYPRQGPGRLRAFLDRYRLLCALLALMSSAWFAADGVSISWGKPFPMFSGVDISPNNMAVAAGLLGLAFHLYFDRSGKAR
jgi:hypothetical protein